MTRYDEYTMELRRTVDRVVFLRAHCGLPGPRGNLELMQAAADAGDESAFHEWIALGSGSEPTDEFLSMCGLVGLGRLLADRSEKQGNEAPGQFSDQIVAELRRHAADTRWRVREGVAMALQRVGDADNSLLFQIVRGWTDDRAYVQRAAVAAVAEPRLLESLSAGRAAVDLVDHVTANLAGTPDRRSDEFRTLRQALAYCWSVVVASCPGYGWPKLESWTESGDPDVRWLLRENLKKTRLIRLDPERVKHLVERLVSNG